MSRLACRRSARCSQFAISILESIISDPLEDLPTRARHALECGSGLFVGALGAAGARIYRPTGRRPGCCC